MGTVLGRFKNKQQWQSCERKNSGLDVEPDIAFRNGQKRNVNMKKTSLNQSKLKFLLTSVALLGLVTAALPARADIMIVDRRLPTANLNAAAGANQSNVAWAEPDLSFFDGDTFTTPITGTWTVNTIRLWFVGYNANNNANLTDDTYLGDFYNNLSLYVGTGGMLNRVSLASFIPGTDTTSNPNVVGTRVQYNGGVGTQLDEGAKWTIVQLDFNNLNLDFAAATQVQFGMYTDNDYAYSHASNAALSGSPQDQADGLFDRFQLAPDGLTATFFEAVDSSVTGWDKSTDINVQVFASPVPEPTTTMFAGACLLLPFTLRMLRKTRTA
jgi:hypothetical protein